ncbi:hypothetical protein [Spirosoma fluminis]
MSLFTIDDAHDYSIPQHQQAGVRPVAEQPGQTHSLIGRVSDAVASVFPAIEPGHSYHYATAGLWSTHDLLLHILRQTGPARITLATWSMTEEPARLLVQGLEEGIILELKALLDVRVRVRNPSVYAFAKHNLAHVALSICHAKVTTIQNEAWNITINGSANYTNNPRIEAGVVTESRDVAEFHREWIEAEMQKAKPFEA